MESIINVFHDDILFELFQWLPINDLLNTAQTCSQFNNVALDDYIWHALCQKDFALDYKHFNENTYYEVYKRCYLLTILKDQLKMQGSLVEINELKTLILTYKKLSKLPNNIGLLTNLQWLYLDGNQIV